MPIVDCKTTPCQSKFAIWEITETLEQLTGLVASVEEQNILNLVSSPQKRVQKIAARACLRQMLGISSEYGVLNTECGKPYLQSFNAPEPINVSLSHGLRFCGAIANKNLKVALDVEWMNLNRSFATVKMFMNDDERSYFESIQQNPHYFYLIWCAKECLYKLLSTYRQEISFRNHLSTFAFEAFENNSEYGSFKAQMVRSDITSHIQIHYYTWEDYTICYSEMNPQSPEELFLS